MLINRTILIPTALAPLARALAAGLSPAGAGMFIVPVYSTTGEITYYISSGWIDESFVALLADADLLFTACEGAATLAQCQELVSHSIVTDTEVEDAYTLIARMGLTLSPVSL